MELEAKLDLDAIQDADNVATLLKKEDLEKIGRSTVNSFDVDKHSRLRWEKKMKEAENLALQLVEKKSYPWPNASNVKFPLLTIAALQFQSRAYPSLIKAPDLVKYRVQGRDPDGAKAARAQRISSHMSWQLLEQDESWEEDQDKAFLALPILGCVFKKSYYCPVSGHNRSKLVLPKNLVVHYYAKSIEDCERKTEILELYEREVRERELRGIFVENDYGLAPVEDAKDSDERQGLSRPLEDTEAPRVFLEQHCYLDLDGDGYKEPYVVTVEKGSKKVARIVARFGDITSEQSLKIKDLQGRIKSLAEGIQEPTTDEELHQALRVEQTIIAMNEEVEELAAQKPKILKIDAVEHYTKIPFIPSPDGGFYDLGFGALLSPINDSVNTLLNQLIDAGSMQNAGGGFLARGARIKGGAVRHEPGKWHKVDTTGSNLRDAIVPMPAPNPSPVLFNLLSLLISYAERVGSVTDAMMGDNPGQNTPAYNMSAMLEQGLQVFNGIFKRVYRAQRAEFRKLYKLNSIYLDQEEYFSYQDSDAQALRVDYTADPKDLIPAADPNAFSGKEKMMKAQAVREAAMSVPGYDQIKVEQRFLESMDIPDAKEVFPTQVNEETGAVELVYPPQPDPELEIKKADMQRRTLEGQSRADKDMILAESKTMVDAATILKLEAEIEAMGDSARLEELKLIQKEQESIRKSLVEVAKIEKAPTESRAD